LELDKVEGPHCWIQWKGTGVCMDFHCACGKHGHVDAEFAYNVQCPACGRVWVMGSHVRMYEPTEEERKKMNVWAIVVAE